MAIFHNLVRKHPYSFIYFGIVLLKDIELRFVDWLKLVQRVILTTCLTECSDPLKKYINKKLGLKIQLTPVIMFDGKHVNKEPFTIKNIMIIINIY